MIEVDAVTGKARAIISEEPQTFSPIARLGAISGKQEPDTAPTSATAKR